ncbi:hypothetical protein EWM64_g8352 [Hericium alpestre]|uniref:Uncharacterized protein n=1 Tax=Hericium alpestre TaxID=135208 RepID=A0A4Y9ZQD2_9AGAM|nr:hypothetical protein EWM64_g8352 [Hericium alpestre]
MPNSPLAFPVLIVVTLPLQARPLDLSKKLNCIAQEELSNVVAPKEELEDLRRQHEHVDEPVRSDTREPRREDAFREGP